MFFVDEAHNKTIKIERLQNRALPIKSVGEKTSSSTRTQQSSTSDNRPPAHKATDAPTTKSVMTTPTTKGKENPYAKPVVSKCYLCGEPEHKSNECPKRRQVNMADYEDENEVKIEIEPEDSDFAEEHRESAACVVQWLL